MAQNGFSSFTTPKKDNKTSQSLYVDIYKNTSQAGFAEITTQGYIGGYVLTGKGSATDGTNVFIINPTYIAKHDLNGASLSTSATYTSLGSSINQSIFCFGNYLYLFNGNSDNSTYTIYNKSDLSIAGTGTLPGAGYAMYSTSNSFLIKLFYINNSIYTVSFNAGSSVVTILKLANTGANGALVLLNSYSVTIGSYSSINQIGCDYSKSLNSICFFNAYSSGFYAINQIVAFSLDTNTTSITSFASTDYAYLSGQFPYLRFYCDAVGNFILLYATNVSYNSVFLYLSTNGSILYRGTNLNLGTGANFLGAYAAILVTKYQFYLAINANSSTAQTVLCFQNGATSPYTKYYFTQAFVHGSGYETCYPYHYHNTGNGIFLLNGYYYFTIGTERVKTI